MKTIYAIRDRVANDLAGFYSLLTLRTDAQAVRYFQDSMNLDKSAIAQHPQDYELIACGEIEDRGTIHAHGEPRIVITGEALIAATTEHQPPQLVKEQA